MKTRFTTIDLMASLQELQQMVGMRVNNVYDVDSKTYLLKLMKPESKCVILIESGLRIHLTEFDYPKNISPSGFSMKLRKHIKQKRLEFARQLGVDRIIDLQFGSGEVACHVIVELFDRGNIALTDHEYTILNVLRPRTDKDTDVKFVVREKYPLHLAKQTEPIMSLDELNKFLSGVKSGENLRKVLNPKFIFGPALLDHALLQVGIPGNAQIGTNVKIPEDSCKIYEALKMADEIFEKTKTSPCHGYIVYKNETKLDGEIIEAYTEFQPILFAQHSLNGLYKEFPTFNAAVDEFFSKIEIQKVEAKGLQQEKAAVKKLENVRKDHEQRLKNLVDTQNVDKEKAELIELNKDVVDRAILQINSALASQLSWQEVQDLIDEAKERDDPVALMIKTLKLDTNHVVLRLSNPFYHLSISDDENSEEEQENSVLVDIDLNLSAYQNARKYYDHKKQSAVKERKTIEASEKALKSAEVKTQELLKQVQLKTKITKSRKTYWFEKFIWFISSDNYLVIGGRDAQQNELIVKRYLKSGDAYVHADIRGAASVVIKNRNPTAPIPPRTLSEAGTMAVCYSAAWDVKIVTSAWWVSSDQVSKTAPSGEYLTTGSFMIRGKKNFLPPCQLIMGFGVLFKLDDDCIAKHLEARRLAKLNREDSNVSLEKDETSLMSETPIEVDSDSSDEEPDQANKETTEDEKNTVKIEETGEAEEFPDVAVRLKHLSVDEAEKNEEVSILQIGPVHPFRTQKQKDQQGTRPALKVSAAKSQEKAKGGIEQPKRGQRGKKKKIKDKYKDQDEEEREMRLKILGSSTKRTETHEEVVKSKESSKGGKLNKEKEKPNVPDDTQPVEQQKKAEESEIVVTNKDIVPSDETQDVVESAPDLELEHAEDANEDLDDINKLTDEASSAVDALTGCPFEDDILIFAVSTCAPYTALNNVKFKVKLTPGTGKKGKATKMAIQVFLKDKSVTSREKDLLKLLNDQDLSRNLPGKVKVSAPQLLTVKRKH